MHGKKLRTSHAQSLKSSSDFNLKGQLVDSGIVKNSQLEKDSSKYEWQY